MNGCDIRLLLFHWSTRTFSFTTCSVILNIQPPTRFACAIFKFYFQSENRYMLLVCDISNLKKKQHRETRVETNSPYISKQCIRFVKQESHLWFVTNLCSIKRNKYTTILEIVLLTIGHVSHQKPQPHLPIIFQCSVYMVKNESIIWYHWHWIMWWIVNAVKSNRVFYGKRKLCNLLKFSQIHAIK